jgi:16S rRNA C967 or C1407 C5-methylase (RsmB/RsmF family)
VYSVCSFEPEETIEVASRFAARHPEFEPVDTGHSESLQTAPGILYLFPHRHGTMVVSRRPGGARG